MNALIRTMTCKGHGTLGGGGGGGVLCVQLDIHHVQAYIMYRHTCTCMTAAIGLGAKSWHKNQLAVARAKRWYMYMHVDSSSKWSSCILSGMGGGGGGGCTLVMCHAHIFT